MPDMPTITVTAEQATRLLGAFDGQVDETGAPITSAQAYRRWLRTTLREYVIQAEAQELDRQHLDARQVALDQLRAELEE